MLMPGLGLGAHSPGPCVQFTTSAISIYLELCSSRNLILHLTTRLMTLLTLTLEKITKILITEQYLPEWLCIVPELDESSREHYHILIAIRTFMNFNKHIKNNILNNIRLKSSLDVNINILYNFELISKKLNYILKQSFENFDKYDYKQKRTIKKQPKLINLA